MKIFLMTAPLVMEEQRQLTALLNEAVCLGASIGYTDAVMQYPAMQKYWEKQSEIMAEGKVHIFCAQANNKIIGVVGLEACTKPNGDHRGEIFKLIVSAQWRRRGVARQLMTVATEFAAQLGLKLLVLDTRSDDITVDFYQSLGWIKAGVIPHYAQSTLGEYQATTLMYLPLTPDTQNIL